MRIPEYWALHPDDEFILLYRFAESNEPRKYVPGDTLTTRLPGLAIDLAAFFREYE